MRSVRGMGVVRLLVAATLLLQLCAAVSAGSWEEQAKLLASDGGPDDLFGYSVSLSGTKAIVGAKWDDDQGTKSGSAYIAQDNGSDWSLVAKLAASDGAEEDGFGWSVAISGATAIVGAFYDDDNGTDSGSAYIFEETDSGWTEAAKLDASDGADEDGFGISVAISGTTAIVGALQDDDNCLASGSAYVFEDTGSGWTQVAKLTASDGADEDGFGYSVSISDSTAIVGAYGDDSNGTPSGSAYIFEDTGSGWSQVAKLTASDGEAGTFLACPCPLAARLPL